MTADHALTPSHRRQLTDSCPSLLEHDVWTYRLAAYNLADVGMKHTWCACLQVPTLCMGALTIASTLQALLSSDAAWTAADADGRQAFAQQALGACMQCLEDAEPRVRLAVGALLHVLAEQQGAAVWEASRDAILGSIEHNWVRTRRAALLSLWMHVQN